MAASVSLVCARARNGVIGRDGGLPWRLKSDMAHFKAVTMGKPIVMGRRTWDSLKRALPGRPNIIVSRDRALSAPGAWVFSGLEVALAAARSMARNSGADEVCVIGGAQIYAEALPLADLLHLTEVHADIEGDALFPIFDEGAFQEIERRDVAAGPGDDYAVTIRALRRR